MWLAFRAKALYNAMIVANRTDMMQEGGRSALIGLVKDHSVHPGTLAPPGASLDLAPSRWPDEIIFRRGGFEEI